MWKIIIIVLALLYVLNPFDILPDLMLGWGWLDDIVILGLLWRYLYSQKKKREAFQKYDQNSRNAPNDGHSHAGNKNESRTYTHADDFTDAWSPHHVLEVEPGASQKEIKQAYRRLAGKYHPDKVEHLGDEFKALAERRFKEIQRAYQELKVK
jgi:DnaJ like chaperone protein